MLEMILNCKDCFDKSFASHEKSIHWSNKNEEKPEFVLKKGDKKASEYWQENPLPDLHSEQGSGFSPFDNSETD